MLVHRGAPRVNAEPNPGSREALDAGCRCPVLDNAHGRGYLGGVKDEQGDTVFVMVVDCPIHGTPGRSA